MGKKNFKNQPAHLTNISALDEMVLFLKTMKELSELEDYEGFFRDEETGIAQTMEVFVSYTILALIQNLRWIQKTDYPIKELSGMAIKLRELLVKLSKIIDTWNCVTINRCGSGTKAKESLCEAFYASIENLEKRKG